jgi:hypothetical protein
MHTLAAEAISSGTHCGSGVAGGTGSVYEMLATHEHKGAEIILHLSGTGYRGPGLSRTATCKVQSEQHLWLEPNYFRLYQHCKTCMKGAPCK